MATVAGVISGGEDTGEEAGVRVVSWLLAEGDVGVAVPLSVFSDRSVQVSGTFGAGGSCSVQGSNDGVNWAVLNDPQGNSLTFAAPRLEAVHEISRYLRPSVPSGDGTTSLSVVLLARRSGR